MDVVGGTLFELTMAVHLHHILFDVVGGTVFEVVVFSDYVEHLQFEVVVVFQ
jgi:hypothetical protein